MYQYQEIDFKILDIWRSVFFFIIKNYFLIYKKDNCTLYNEFILILQPNLISNVFHIRTMNLSWFWIHTTMYLIFQFSYPDFRLNLAIWLVDIVLINFSAIFYQVNSNYLPYTIDFYINSYTVYNCPNTEKYRVNEIHIGRGNIFRIRTIVHCVTNLSWYLMFSILGQWQLPVQSVPITTKVVSLNPVHGEVYSIQHYVIKFVSDLRQVGGFLHQ
jgi:hypothetical protein